jgi:hypothetical protein
MEVDIGKSKRARYGESYVKKMKEKGKGHLE